MTAPGDGQVEGDSALAAVAAATIEMVSRLPEALQTLVFAAAEVGDQPMAFRQPDGTLRVEIGGVVLGVIRLVDGTVPDDLSGLD